MITRENYEEFFLSYVDDELPETVRAAVERFVADNPDLGPELEALLQCRVAPDHESGFRDKNILFQYESSLLSYVDGELEEPGRTSLEEWVQRHPGAARELRHLQMTVSRPDLSIVCPDKESLYRDQRRRAVVLLWLRAGVAAAVLAGVALLLLPRQHSSGTVAVAPKNISPAVTSAAPPALYSTVKDDRKNADTPVKARPARIVVKYAVRKQEDTKERPVVVAPTVKNEVAIADPQPLKQQTITVEQNKIASAEVNIPKEQSSFATQALMQQEQEHDNSIAEVSATPPKNKLRGLFRKVGRAFGTTAERDDDGQRQVLISAFQVALK